MQKRWHEEKKPYVVGLFGMLLFSAGLILGYLSSTADTFPSELRSPHTGTYRYVNQLLSCGDISTVSEKSLVQARRDVTQFAEQQKQAGNVDDISLYFRDLNNGGWFLLDGDKAFSPGSLLKVPVMMSAIRKNEMMPDFFSKKVLFATSTSELTPKEKIPASDPIQIGKTYSIEELVHRMVVSSDNNATKLVYYAVGTDAVNDTFDELGLPPPTLTGDYVTNIKEYPRFFRVLYNATYLSAPESEMALHTLTKSEFKKGLVAGVPSGVEIAHKFGEREFEDTVQLHDCGIVYAKKYPYLLCIMTRGKDISTLSSVIAGLSKIVYNDVNNYDKK